MSTMMILYGVLVLALTFLMGNKLRKAKWTISGQMWIIGGILYWLIEHQQEVEQSSKLFYPLGG